MEAHATPAPALRVPPRREKRDRWIGTTVDGRYVLEERIARGAMGCVYLARQQPFDRLVALKLLDPRRVSKNRDAADAEGPSDGETSEQFEERFVLEAAALARLQHPNTVKVYDYGRWQGRTFLVMEYVDGSSLRRLQAGGPVPASRLINIMNQVCDALQEAHALGLIHRDLKPANLLLSRHAGALDVVKVVDFGLAKEFYGNTEITQEGQVLGTPMFMAPEQIRDKDCDGRTDIYALGVLMYRSLTGVLPFEKGKATEVLMAHLKRYAPPFAEANPDLDVPKMLEDIVFTCMAKRVEDRFANVVELKRALDLCQRVLEDRSLWGLRLEVDQGVTVVPLALTGARDAMAAVDGTPLAKTPDGPLDGLPAATVAVLLGVVGMSGLLCGAALFRLLGA